MNLFSKVGKYKVSVWNIQYKVNRLLSANILPQVVIWESHLNTKTTTTSIRTQLSSLNDFIGTIGCDITKFNFRVKLLPAGLSERGEIINDLLSYSFKGYKAESDSVFVKLY